MYYIYNLLEEEELVIPILCQICQSDIASLELEERIRHANICIDRAQKGTSVVNLNSKTI